jgi:hypothetical protein
MSDERQNITRRRTTQRIEHFNEIAIGQWYWVDNRKNGERDGESNRWLGCVTEIGSNYVEITGPSEKYSSSQRCTRVHLKDFERVLTLEPNAEMFIRDKVEHFRLQTEKLMDEVKQLTAGLAITPRNALDSGDTDATQALSTRNRQQDIGDYKKALIKAKEKQLPKLFEQLRDNNELMASWMSAAVIPLEAEAHQLEGLQDQIGGRIFNVELYAGLVEEVKCIKEGEPAAITERVRLFQRRCYMDEECLANYETGGMEFKDLRAFDKWFVKPENLSRLLPFQRCVVAFQVRRFTKEREAAGDLRSFIKMMHLEKADKFTFLYIRNGERVYRLSTEIEFDARLFPDQNLNLLEGKVYAKMWGGQKVEDVIDESRYLGMVEDYENARKCQAAAIKRLKRDKVPRKDWWEDDEYENFGIRNHADGYIEWSPDSVYYDDVAAHIQKEIDKHNRLVLILQGLFDRSEVFHPHPPLQLWSHEGFTQALGLIYDDSRALVSGDRPDFEAYRAQLNKSLKKGSITVGQQDYWLRYEAEKENRRRRNDWRLSARDRDYECTRYQPYGNPGPGNVAKVVEFGKRGATFLWKRDRQGQRYRGQSDEINCVIRVPPAELLNVSAYTPGDFKLFYADPRTRADYLQWAPLLLEAEEYWAGNRKVK